MSDLTDDEIDFLNGCFDLARDGDVEQLTELLDAGLPVNLTNAQGDTLLILAAYREHPDLVELLLARGADHSRVNDRGQTALAAAVFRRSERSVRALLAAGADPAHGPRSALSIAEYFELPQMAALLRGEDATPGD